MCMRLHELMLTIYMQECIQSTEECVGSTGTGVTSSCELFNLGARNQIRLSCKNSRCS